MKKHFWISLAMVMAIIIVFGTAGAIFALLYPIKYEKEIVTYATEFDLDPGLVASVINVESGFEKNEVSSVGAIGLMQIMPSTAVEIANKLQVDEFMINDLYDVNVNIRFGCYYLRYLIDLYDGNVDTALAGYNAGLFVVNGWLINSEYSDDNQTLKTIPYKETSKFVDRVNNNLNIYKKRF